MRNATKLDSRQLQLWGFKWEMQPNLIQDNYSCEDSNEKCKQTWFKTIIVVRIQMRNATKLDSRQL